MKKSLIFIHFFLIFLLLCSCYNKSNKFNTNKNNENFRNFVSLNSDSNNSNKIDTNKNISFQDNNNYLVYNANIKGKIKSIYIFQQNIITTTNTNNGFIYLIEKYNNFEILIISRIPKDNFYNYLDSIKKLFMSIDNERIQIEDISQQYIDIEARLNVKKESEKRFLSLLQKATSVKDTIEIEQALMNIREEIDSFEANLRYLKNSIQYSTITINAYIEKINIINENLWLKFLNSLVNGLNTFISFILLIISLWPFILILLFFLFFFYKKFKIIKKPKN